MEDTLKILITLSLSTLVYFFIMAMIHVGRTLYEHKKPKPKHKS